MKYKYTNKELEDVVKISFSYASVMNKLGIKLSGGNHAYIRKKIRNLGLDTSHFSQKKTIKNYHKKNANIVLVLREHGEKEKTYILRRAMIEVGIPYVCDECGITEYNGKPIVLEIHHINGNWLDNRIENVRFLCPNCHSQHKILG